ncbi:MAG TPA: LacI family DNA-binding transcriptional regulator [Propionibacteriaceae bacterium]|nr:LacI family DNA-binding transcriptional regulator [Propionibacteriaceae bacterium]
MGRQVSSADVAELAGVSRATVSYVINETHGRRIGEATRQRVLDAVAALGYVPDSSARALRSGQTTVALLYLGYTGGGEAGPIIQLSGVGWMLQDAVARGMRTLGKALLLWSDASRPLEEALHSLTPCLVIAPLGLPDDARAALQDAGVPVVTLAGWGEPMDPTGTESWAAGRLQLEHLVSRGHRQIGYINAGGARFQGMTTGRLGGAMAASAEHPIEPLRVYELPSPGSAPSDGIEAQLQNWVANGVTAVACFNDIIAARTLQAARNANLHVPAQLALIGCDDDIVAALGQPPLTTVRFDVEAMAHDLVEQGRAALQGTPRPAPAPPRVELVQRATT